MLAPRCKSTEGLEEPEHRVVALLSVMNKFLLSTYCKEIRFATRRLSVYCIGICVGSADWSMLW